MRLTRFNEYGLLPARDFPMTFAQLRQSILVKGPHNRPENWDALWRAHLVDNLEILVKQLWKAGIKNIYINGSFVESKDHPNDIDGYFECDLLELATGRLERNLNLLDGYKAWTWDPENRELDADSGKRQLPMWHIYRVELYPHYNQSSGIKDLFGNELMFPSAFRKSRTEDRQKGIVKIVAE